MSFLLGSVSSHLLELLHLNVFHKLYVMAWGEVFDGDPLRIRCLRNLMRVQFYNGDLPLHQVERGIVLFSDHLYAAILGVGTFH
jgi:hypothetical protein